ncbi:MAG: hypothetical protein WC789_10695 [Lentisphaeria bacterium]
MRDVAFIFDGAGLTPTVQWFARECVTALREAFHVQAFVVGGGHVPLPLLDPLGLGAFVDRGNRPVIVEVDRAVCPGGWSPRSSPLRVRAFVDQAAHCHAPESSNVRPWRMSDDGWMPVVRADAIDYRPGPGSAFVWRGGPDPTALFNAMARGALVVAAVRDRWTACVPGCFAFVDPAREDVDTVLDEYLSDARERTRLTRLARERVEFLSPERFVGAFEGVSR